MALLFIIRLVHYRSYTIVSTENENTFKKILFHSDMRNLFSKYYEPMRALKVPNVNS